MKSTSSIAACGCFVPPNPVVQIVQAGERIVFATDGDDVIAHVQIQYQGDAQDFGWLLPHIDRGWLAYDGPTEDAADQAPAPPPGQVTITGWVRTDGEGGSTEVSDGGMRAISSNTGSWPSRSRGAAC